jgi:glycosyltransferase involved in cell wall biosynthesis
MRIALDGLALSHSQAGGFKTYVSSLVQHLALVDDQNEYCLFLGNAITQTFPPNWQTKILPTRLRGLGTALREQVSLPRACNQAKVDVMHSPCATGPILSVWPQVVTIHDTIEFTQPLPSWRSTHVRAMRLYSRQVQHRLAHKADAIITVSHYSKDRIVCELGVPPERVFAIHPAPNPQFSVAPISAAPPIEVYKWAHGAYVLALASASPRKNIPHLMREYALLDPDIREQYNLVLVVAHPYLKNDLKSISCSLGIADQVHLMEQVSDSMLVDLYRCASLFVFPSLDEGFGLPPLEAMACGTPVVASNAGSLPEILGDAALLVNPVERSGLTNAMYMMLTDSALIRQYQARGIRQSAQYSWTRTAQETLALYERVYKG